MQQESRHAAREQSVTSSGLARTSPLQKKCNVQVEISFARAVCALEAMGTRSCAATGPETHMMQSAGGHTTRLQLTMIRRQVSSLATEFFLLRSALAVVRPILSVATIIISSP